MTNIIVASFKEEAKALTALHKMSEMELFGDLTVYERAILKKNKDGKTELLKTETSEGLGTLGGMAIGSLIGALLGPVGLIAGFFTGAFTGAAIDVYHYGFSEDFRTKVLNDLEPGRVAIIAEIDTESSALIEDELKVLGATVTSSDVTYELEIYRDEKIEAIDKQISETRSVLKTAAVEVKPKLQDKIAVLKEQRKARITELEKKSKDSLSE